jgi:hypothetical protein
VVFGSRSGLSVAAAVLPQESEAALNAAILLFLALMVFVPIKYISTQTFCISGHASDGAAEKADQQNG